MTCVMGDLCRTPEVSTSLGSLCESCEKRGKVTIGSLLSDYIALSEELAPTGATLGAGVGSNRVDPPLPVRMDVDAQMRHIRWIVVRWAPRVRNMARLTPLDFEGAAHRAAVEVGLQVLQDHYNDLLTHPTVVIQDYRSGAWTSMDGPGAVVEMARIHRRSRLILGITRVWEEREMPCPGEPLSDGCGERTLGTYIGSGRVECARCGWFCTTDDYAKYVLTNVPVGSRGSPAIM